jgi:hypothetical protein
MRSTGLSIVTYGRPVFGRKVRQNLIGSQKKVVGIVVQQNPDDRSIGTLN